MTEVIEITPELIAADAATTESPDLAPVDIAAPETTEVKAIPDAIEKPEVKTEEKADTKETDKVEDKIDKTPAPFEPSKAQKSIHEKLQAFWNDKLMSAEGKASDRTPKKQTRLKTK